VNGGAAASVAIPDHSYISTSSLGSGNAGSIEIDSQSIALHNGGFISSDGNGGAARLFVGALTIDSGAYVSTSVGNPATNSHAGSILIAGVGGAGSAAQSVSVSGTDSLLLAASTQPSPSGSGQAGSVTIDADQVSFTANGGIVVSTLNGGGGQVAITTRDLTMSSGGSIRGDATGAGGTAGDVTISASNAVRLDAALITAESLANSNAGNVYINAPTVRLSNASEVSAAAVQTGQAGSVRVTANDLYLNARSRIDATSNLSRAGNVELIISDVAWLTDSVISGLSADPVNGGGNFIIRQPKALILQDSQILANSANSAGGNVSITADAIVQDPSSSVTATGQVFEVGSVLSGVLQLRSPTVPDAASRLDTRCTTQQIAERSSMIVRSTPAGAVRDAYLIANSPKRPIDPAISLAAIPLLPCDTADPWQIP
jgi:large exoprotein involved in heme utilization and adhesion